MKHNKISDYNGLVLYHLSKTRDILSKINKNKKAMYWSNEDTFSYRYKDGDIIQYWGKITGIKEMAKLYTN